MRISDWSSDVCSSDLVGVNKYRLKDEDLLETLEVDNSKVREAQVARINRVKASRDEAACRAALKALRDAAAAPQSVETNLLAHAVEAARARATLGEISSAMEEAFGRYATVPTPVRSEEHTSELQSLMRISYAVFCLKKKQLRPH